MDRPSLLGRLIAGARQLRERRSEPPQPAFTAQDANEPVHSAAEQWRKLAQLALGPELRRGELTFTTGYVLRPRPLAPPRGALALLDSPAPNLVANHPGTPAEQTSNQHQTATRPELTSEAPPAGLELTHRGQFLRCVTWQGPRGPLTAPLFQDPETLAQRLREALSNPAEQLTLERAGVLALTNAQVSQDGGRQSVSWPQDWPEGLRREVDQWALRQRLRAEIWHAAELEERTAQDERHQSWVIGAETVGALSIFILVQGLGVMPGQLIFAGALILWQLSILVGYSQGMRRFMLIALPAAFALLIPVVVHLAAAVQLGLTGTPPLTQQKETFSVIIHLIATYGVTAAVWRRLPGQRLRSGSELAKWLDTASAQDQHSEAVLVIIIIAIGAVVALITTPNANLFAALSPWIVIGALLTALIARDNKPRVSLPSLTEREAAQRQLRQTLCETGHYELCEASENGDSTSSGMTLRRLGTEPTPVSLEQALAEALRPASNSEQYPFKSSRGALARQAEQHCLEGLRRHDAQWAAHEEALGTGRTIITPAAPPRLNLPNPAPPLSVSPILANEHVPAGAGRHWTRGLSRELRRQAAGSQALSGTHGSALEPEAPTDSKGRRPA